MRTVQLAFFLTLTFMGPWLMATPSVDSTETAANTPVIQEKPSQNNLLGFKDWKQTRVFKARNDLDAFKAPDSNVEKSEEKSNAPSEQKPEAIEGASSEVPAIGTENTEIIDENKNQTQLGPKLEAQAEKLRQLEFNLEIAQGLTIHDYFALYLKDKSKEDMAKAIEKLSSDEISELLLAYRTSLYGLPVNVKNEKNQINQNL